MAHSWENCSIILKMRWEYRKFGFKLICKPTKTNIVNASNPQTTNQVHCHCAQSENTSIQIDVVAPLTNWTQSIHRSPCTAASGQEKCVLCSNYANVGHFASALCLQSSSNSVNAPQQKVLVCIISSSNEIVNFFQKWVFSQWKFVACRPRNNLSRARIS